MGMNASWGLMPVVLGAGASSAWSWSAQWLAAAVGVVTLMTVVYCIQRLTRNAGYVDVAWAAGIGVVSLSFAAWSAAPLPRRIAVAVIVAAWSVRLTSYLFVRVRGEEEDGRYTQLRESWGDSFQWKLFLFYQIQAMAVLLFALAPWLALQAHRPALDIWDMAGVLIAAVGLGGTALADLQLSRFRSQGGNRGKTCEAGLWRYSRHPNYFFEWLHWWGFTLIAVGGPFWWLAPITPLALLYTLLYKTGIPATEAQAVASRGDNYRQYQRTTSAFVPWFRKSDADPS